MEGRGKERRTILGRGGDFFAIVACCLSITALVAYCESSSSQLLVKEPQTQKSIGKSTFGTVEKGDGALNAFKARQLLLDGRPFDWAQAEWKTEKPVILLLSAYEIAYRSCAFRKSKEEETDPGCQDWVVLDLQNRNKRKLDLPDFDHFASSPSAQKPYISYASVSKDRLLGCTVYDWELKRVVAQEVTDLPILPTDADGYLAPPTFFKDGKSVACVLEGFTDKVVSKKVTLRFK